MTVSPCARSYIASVLVVGAALGGAALCTPLPTPAPWLTAALLLAVTTVAQLNKAEAPNHVLFYTSPVFFFAGAFLLPPALILPLIAVPHVLEWGRERLRRSEYLRAWYLQPFNIAMYTLATLAAHSVLWMAALVPGYDGGGPWSVVAVLAAAVCYVAVNAALLGGALALARGVSWRESGVLDPETVLLDALLVCVGSTVAVVWRANPWMLALTLAPLLLMYRALLIPQLKRDAETDAKTGLLSARHFGVLLEAELNRTMRFSRPLAVMMADLDRFKAINDTHGHLAGDAVLAAVGRIIRASLREYDIAGRFGGEEFVLALPELTLPEAQAAAERLRQALAEAVIPLPGGSVPLRVTMSVGVACAPRHGITAAALTEAADVAVYRAKAAGRNRVVCAGDEAGEEGAPLPITAGQGAAARVPESLG